MIVTIKQGDTYPPLRAYLQMGDGSAINLDGATVKLVLVDTNNNPKLSESMSVLNAAEGLVSYSWQATDTEDAGSFKAEIEVTLQSGDIVTVPNDGHFTVNIVSELGQVI